MANDTNAIDLIGDVIAVLDADDVALAAEKTSLEAQKADLEAQLAVIIAKLAANAEDTLESTLFRQLATDIQSGAAFSSVLVPGAPMPNTSEPPVI